MSEQPDGTGESDGTHGRRRLLDLALVFAGGTAGTLARFGLTGALPAPTGLPLGIFLINISGAFLLGILIEALAHRRPDEGRPRSMRLLIGTGFLGGFTTYSALAVDALLLLVSGRVLAGVVFLGGSVLVGLGATVAGITVGNRVRRRSGSTADTTWGAGS